MLLTRTLFLLLFLLSGLAIEAKGEEDPSTVSRPTTLQGWTEKLQKQSLIPQEIVYAHLDNNCYFLGDTIYYKTYVTNSATGQLSQLSKVLYVELFNQDGYLQERQMLKLYDGQAYGSFCIPDTAYAGYYELRAYTRWQLNWGEYEHEHSTNANKWFLTQALAHDYFRDYDKLYSRVFPVYNRPTQKGIFDHVITTRPMRRYFRNKTQKPEADVNFYPEGGTWLLGKEQRVAFEAVSETGEHLDGELVILDRRKKEVARAKTEHRGRGVLTMRADSAMHYKARFVGPDSLVFKIDFPKIETDGVALTVTQENGLLHITTDPSGKAMQDELGITIMRNGQLKHQQFLSAGQKATTDYLTPDTSGIYQVTVFNSEGRVWADRQVFVRRADVQPSNLTISNVKGRYEPYEKITLSVSAPKGSKPGATLSMAVRDAALSDYTNDNGTLLTEMLLSSQVKGFIEQPGYYFEADDDQHRRHLDLLMMVQGWRRYRWEDITAPFVMKHPVEKYRTVKGEVFKMEFPEKPVYNPLIRYPIDNYTELVRDLTFSGSGPLTLNGFKAYWHNDVEYMNDMHMVGGFAQTNTGKVFISKYGELNTQIGKSKKTGDDVNYYRLMGDYETVPTDVRIPRPVMVHAEFSRAGDESFEGEVMTDSLGNFTLVSPTYDGEVIMHLAASDTTTWEKLNERRDRQQQKRAQALEKNPNKRFSVKNLMKASTGHSWVQPNEEEDPEFYVRLNWCYPRFIKPYSFYHTQTPTLPENSPLHEFVDDRDATLMRQVTIGARRGGMRELNKSKPAFRLDAYEAFNAACDAGLMLPKLYSHELMAANIAACYMGEMGIPYRSYFCEVRYNSYNASHPLTPQHLHDFDFLNRIDSVIVYSDYQPRLEGDRKYQNDNIPEVNVDLRAIPDDGLRATFRDRRYHLPGYNVCEDFYQPRYEQRPLPSAPKDYRRTLYWNPSLRLDATGQATFSFYNNSRRNQLEISAEGITSDGRILIAQ